MHIQKRKKDHVDLTVSGKSAFTKSAGFERYEFRHNALPELDLNEIDPSIQLMGRRFSLPLFISSMTGGYDGAAPVNAILSSFCEKNNLPMGVGSQRAMLEDPELESSFSIVRQTAPTAFIASNIGGVQLIEQWSEDKTHRLISSIKADAVIVHLNPSQELVQPEGDRNFRGILDGIRRLVDSVDVPVIVKETGAGISQDVALRLIDVGVNVIDVAGAGGTSWSRVEAWRREDGDHDLDEWGMPTVDCLLELAPLASDKIQLIASGGIRTAQDMLKALCLGARCVAMAQPIIAMVKEEGQVGLDAYYDRLQHKLRCMLLLLGCRTPAELRPTHLRIL